MLAERAVLPAALERLSPPGCRSVAQVQKIGKAAPGLAPPRSSPRRGLAGASPGSADDGIAGHQVPGEVQGQERKLIDTAHASNEGD